MPVVNLEASVISIERLAALSANSLQKIDLLDYLSRLNLCCRGSLWNGIKYSSGAGNIVNKH